MKTISLALRSVLIAVVSFFILPAGIFAATQECSYLGPDNKDEDTFTFFANLAGGGARIQVTRDDVCPVNISGEEAIVVLTNLSDGSQRTFRGPLPISWDDDLIPTSGDYAVSITNGKTKDKSKEPKDKSKDPKDKSEDKSKVKKDLTSPYIGTYCVRVTAEIDLDLQPTANVEPDPPLTIYAYPDADGDGCGDPAGRILCADRDPTLSYVPNGCDCNDNNPQFTQYCQFVGFTACTEENRYSVQCNPPVSNIEAKWKSGYQNLAFLEGKYGYGTLWPPGNSEPWTLGGTEISAHHIQAIQHMTAASPNTTGALPQFVITSVAETTTKEGPQWYLPSIDAVLVDNFADPNGSTGELVKRYELWNPVYNNIFHNHAGGMQAIGEYLFVAMEGPNIEPNVQIIRFNRDPTNPEFNFVSKREIPTSEAFRYKGSAVGLTKLWDESYLMAFCSSSNCEQIQLYKSGESDLGKTGIDIGSNFDWMGTWDKDEQDPWPDCGPQGMNLVVEKMPGPNGGPPGRIYVVLFGIDDPGIGGCDSATGKNVAYLYELVTDYSQAPYQVDLVYKERIVFQNKPKCWVALWNDGNWDDEVFQFWFLIFEAEFAITRLASDVSALNFLAGSGLTIGPNGQDDVGFLVTEHYNSCGEELHVYAFVPETEIKNPQYSVVEGRTHWGVTENVGP